MNNDDTKMWYDSIDETKSEDTVVNKFDWPEAREWAEKNPRKYFFDEESTISPEAWRKLRVGDWKNEPKGKSK